MTAGVDVVTETDISAPLRTVAAFVSDPDNAPVWYVNIKSVEWKTPKAIAVGARIAFVASFLGRKLDYIYEIVELDSNRKLVMRTEHGPFPMETTYEWQPISEGVTHMRLRNRGMPSGFSKLVAPLMASAMRKANEKDLAKLKTLLET